MLSTVSGIDKIIKIIKETNALNFKYFNILLIYSNNLILETCLSIFT